MLIVVLALLSNLLYAQDSSNRAMDLRKITSLFLASDLKACKKELPDCEKLFNLTFRKETIDVSMKLKSAAVFGTLFDMADACIGIGKTACDLVKVILNDNKDECSRFNNNYSQLCADVRSFRLKNCNNIKNPFLASTCFKKINLACQNDPVCLIAWSYAFREDVQVLKTMKPEIREAFLKTYEEEKIFVKDSLVTLLPANYPLQKFVRAPLFPQPLKVTDFNVPRKSKMKKTAGKSTLKFKKLSIVNDAFLPNMRELLHPWRRGTDCCRLEWRWFFGRLYS